MSKISLQQCFLFISCNIISLVDPSSLLGISRDLTDENLANSEIEFIGISWKLRVEHNPVAGFCLLNRHVLEKWMSKNISKEAVLISSDG